MVLVFDLDDTLYDEKTYAISGFRAVANFLTRRYRLPEKKILREMVKIEAERGQIFDRVLQNHGVYSKKLVKECVKVYRRHLPKLKLHADAGPCLKRFKNVPLYILTDGHKEVQLQKLKALGLWKSGVVRHAYRTNAYGRLYAKPHRFCFDLIAKREKESPKNIVYIGDNPKKDFVVKKWGYKTIRVNRGHYKDLKMGPKFDAHVTISSLKQLNTKTLKKLGITYEE